MGIPKLNKLLLEKCNETNHIHKMHLKELSGKTIVIDTSIYLYKFSLQNRLIENFYLLISLFNYYNIVPVFIFDGKPPPEKKDLLDKRKINKKAAEFKYDKIKSQLCEEQLTNQQRIEINKEMEKLQKDFIRIKDCHIKSIQELLSYYGITYYTCEGEEDLLCCKLVLSGEAWACLSDDMDLFVYGCTRILRYISILNATVLYYDTNEIFKTIDTPLDDFKKIISLSGTDYNLERNINIHKCFDYYYKYKEEVTDTEDFYDWLKKKKIIENVDELRDITKLFDTSVNIDNEKIENKKDLMKLISFLTENDFVFIS